MDEILCLYIFLSQIFSHHIQINTEQTEMTISPPLLRIGPITSSKRIWKRKYSMLLPSQSVAILDYIFCKSQILNSCFLASRINVNKNVQLDATVCRHLFTAKSLYMFRVSQYPSLGALKTVTAISGIGHNTGTATSFQRGLIRTPVLQES